MSAIKRPTELLALKRKAMAFYEENGVPKRMEEVLNSAFYDNPADIYGHLANFFESHSKEPIISKLKGRQALDSKGQISLQTDVYCTLKNKEQLMSSFVSCSTNSRLLENVKQEDKDVEDKERMESVAAAINFIIKEFNDSIKNINPSQQEEIDKLIYSHIDKVFHAEEEQRAKEAEENAAESQSAPDSERNSNPKKPKSPKSKGAKSAQILVIPEEPPERFLCGSNAVCAVSQSVCSAAAKSQATQVFEHIRFLKTGESPSRYTLPSPFVTIMQCGKGGSGKLNCIKEFMVVPKPDMPFSESIAHIADIYAFVAKSLSNKGGLNARYVNDIGALCPSYDKPEQGLDILQEAITSIGLTPGEDIFIALNCAGQEMFDCDKGKYEVVNGQARIADDMPEYWADLVSRYPAILALIDPVRKQEQVQWMTLCEKLTSKCFILGDYIFKRPARQLDEALTDQFKANGIIFKLENMNTVTDIIACAKRMEENDYITAVTSGQGESTDTFLADLALGIGSSFIKTGAPNRGERVALLNRLAQIEDYLESNNKLECRKEHQFREITIPVPPEPDEDQADGDDGTSSQKSDAKKK